MKLTDFSPKPTLLSRAAENLSALLIKVMVSNTPEPFTISSRFSLVMFPFLSVVIQISMFLFKPHITYPLILGRGFVPIIELLTVLCITLIQGFMCPTGII